MSQGFLSSKEALARTTSELSRIGALECLAALSQTFGGQLGSSIPESVSLASKHCYRSGFSPSPVHAMGTNSLRLQADRST